jgi:succinoglycan biosynthesis protein ExoM
LPALLEALENQAGDGPVRVYVADNGSTPARDLVAAHRGRLEIRYQRVEEPGVSAARNVVLHQALSGGFRFMAFLDDDERPEPGWLAALLACAAATSADIVCGAVVPDFETEPPFWVRPCGVFEKSGEVPGTSNLLVSAAILPAEPGLWFQARYGRIGGSDREFLGRLIRAGARFAAAPGAVLHEHVPSRRMTFRHMFRIGLRDGLCGVPIEFAAAGGGLAGVRGAGAFVGAKLVYGLNHLAFAAREPARLALSVRDLGTVAGALLSVLGIRLGIYGPAGSGGRR